MSAAIAKERVQWCVSGRRVGGYWAETYKQELLEYLTSLDGGVSWQEEGTLIDVFDRLRWVYQ